MVHYLIGVGTFRSSGAEAASRGLASFYKHFGSYGASEYPIMKYWTFNTTVIGSTLDFLMPGGAVDAALCGAFQISQCPFFPFNRRH